MMHLRARRVWPRILSSFLLVATVAVTSCAVERSDAPVDKLASVELLFRAGNGLPEGADARRLLHQVRNHETMRELVNALPQDQRPASILYLAAGSHMAPLTLCEALPRGVPCRLLYTELDPAVEGAISEFLAASSAVSYSTEAKKTEAPGGGATDTTWRFLTGGREVDLTLRVRAADAGDGAVPLVQPQDLQGVDLVISHDLSGEPLGNLRVIYELVEAMRAAGMESWPSLMIEDLEAHPYAVDLHFFSPLARQSGEYGHRGADEGPGRHGIIELGAPVFGGAVLLGWQDSWLREVDAETLRGVFDFLLINRFDVERQNVLTGGDDPLLAPAILDWWTGFGGRSIDGLEHPLDLARKKAAVRAAATARSAMSNSLAERMACRLALYRSLLEARVAGDDWRSLLPSSQLTTRPEPGSFPSVEMEDAYRDAIRHARDYRAAEEELVSDDRALLVDMAKTPVVEAITTCPIVVEDTAEVLSRVELYRSLRRFLGEAEDD